MRRKFMLMILAPVFISVSGCSGISATDAPILTKRSAWRLAEQSAHQEGISLESYKRQSATYIKDKSWWCMTYEERGYFLAVGDQFAVLIEADSGRTKIIRDAGWVHVATKAKLEQEIANLKTDSAEQGTRGNRRQRP